MKLIFLYGPPAVGKLTVAKLLSQTTGWKLLHNHLLQNPITEVFPFDNPANTILVREFRLRMLEEAAKSNIDLIATFGVAGNSPFRHIADVIATVEGHNAVVCLVHLTATRDTLLERVNDRSRIEHGKNLSEEKLKDMLSGNKDMFDSYSGSAHLAIDTSNVPPEEAVRKICEHYNL